MNVKPTKQLALGVLDACLLYGGVSRSYAIARACKVAQRAEALGYTRFWITEHHEKEAAHGSPEILMAVIAGITSTIRVGSAGVLLNLYSPFKVAENFILLNTLYPNRLDFGVGRGGSSSFTAKEILDGRTPPDAAGYAARFSRLLSYVRTPEAHPGWSPTPPLSIWALGSGTTSASVAASEGVAFALALFLPVSTIAPPSVLEEYRAAFRRCGDATEPQCCVAVAGACAESEGEASRLLAGHPRDGLIPSIVGTPAHCKARLLELQQQYQCDEIIFLDLCQTIEAKVRSYELLADAIGIQPDKGLRPQTPIATHEAKP